MNLMRYSLTILLLTLIAGCGTLATNNPSADVSPPREQHSQLAQLLEKAEKQQFDLYAPETFSEVTDYYLSTSKYLTSRPAKAKESAGKGIRLARQLADEAENIKQKLAPVDKARQNAVAAGAADLLKEDMAEADEQLADTARILEDKPDYNTEELSKELIETYSNIELRALKQDVMGKADNLLDMADERDLAKYAPRTMRLAEEEFLAGTSLLAADRTQTERAAIHAENVVTHIEHAEAITERIKQFQKSESTLEDVLLWHENQLAEAAQPIIAELPKRQGFAALALAMGSGITRVVDENEVLKVEITAAQAEIAAAKSAANTIKKQKEMDIDSLRQDMEQQMLAVQLESDAAKRRIEEQRKRLRFVQELFTTEEADVYQQGQNVLIRAHGFAFMPGSSEVTEENVALINKLIDAAEAFPKANFEVSGHTDNRGNSNINQRLSEERAKAVADFMIIAGLIAEERIISVGHGARNPVATNDTASGRAANRRVEVLIINSSRL